MNKGQRRQLIALLATALIVISGQSVIADEAAKGTSGEATFEFSDPVPATTELDDHTRSTFYPAFAFRHRGTGGGESLTHDSVTGCVYSSDSGFLSTEVNLPHGARVDELTLYAKDTGTGTVSVFLSEFDTDGFPGSGPTLFDLFGVFSSGTSGDQKLSDTSPSVPARAFIDALDSNYVLQARTSGGSDTRFCGARLVWSIPDPGVVLHPLDACKIYDTRPGKGGREAPLASKESERLFVVRNSFKSLGGAAGNCGIPADAEGLLLSVNVLTSTAHGGIRMWTHGEAKPTSPSLIFNRGVRTSSAVPVVLSPQDKIMIHNSSNGETHVELVVLGWYSPPKS